MGGSCHIGPTGEGASGPRRPPPPPPPAGGGGAAPPAGAEPARFGTASVVLGLAGLLPVLPLVGSIAAVVCGWLARDAPAPDRDRGRIGIVLGVLGLLAPVIALFVYCVVLGYPFPIHRYRAG